MIIVFWNAEYFKSLLSVSFCENAPPRRAKEEATYIFFLDFIDECEGMEIGLVVPFRVNLKFIYV